ncbi:hypothetical protein ACIP5T_06925 [Microbacterium sp. NPDC088619]|uniref:hypothetical protein n=1 Tax=Microbacterium sp. NPDC088619 TaxID=3364196 RepID=UPI00382133EA
MTELTPDEVKRIIAAETLTATANWFGRTGRRESSAWIDSDGDGWLVWETDERGGIFHDPLRFASEAEALDLFLKIARRYRAGDSSATRRLGGSS